MKTVLHSSIIAVVLAALLATDILITSCAANQPSQEPGTLQPFDPASRMFITLSETDDPIQRAWIGGTDGAGMALYAGAESDELELQALGWSFGADRRSLTRRKFRSAISAVAPVPVSGEIDLGWNHIQRTVSTEISTEEFGETITITHPEANKFVVNILPAPFDFETAPNGDPGPSFSISNCVATGKEPFGAGSIFEDPCNSSQYFWRPFVPEADREVACSPNSPGCDFDFSGCDPDNSLNTTCPRYVAELRIARRWYTAKGARSFLPVNNMNCTRAFDLGTIGQCSPESFHVFARSPGTNTLSTDGAPNPTDQFDGQLCNQFLGNSVFPACGSGKFMCTVTLRPETLGGSRAAACNMIVGDVEGSSDAVLGATGLENCCVSSGPHPCTDIGTCTFPDCSGMHRLWSCPFIGGDKWVVEDLHDGAGSGEGPVDTCGCNDND